MTYNFDEVTNRRGTGSVKWDVKENELPMWIADMDFPTAPAVREAISARAAHGIFGYSEIPEAWGEAYRAWWHDRHGLDADADMFVFTTGVIPALSSAVRKLTTPAEKVVIQTPVYNMFFNCILNNGRQVLESPLVYENGEYHIDFVDLEEKFSDPQARMMILCNPHNPVGKIWDRETLARIGALAERYNIIVVSDEIHCDLTDPGHDYVPYASASETCRNNSVTCLTPTKAFNMAGLHTAAVMVPNPHLRHLMWRGLNTDEVGEPNAFAVDAAVAALTRGGEWLDDLRAYILENKETVRRYVGEHCPEVHVVASDATYLLWLDVSALTEDGVAFAHFLRETTGLYLTAGAQYGTGGEAFLRLNTACPRVTLTDGLERLARGVALWKNK